MFGVVVFFVYFALQLFFHPKSYYRLLSQRLRTIPFVLRCKRHRVTLQIGDEVFIRNCKVFGKGGTLSIGDSCHFDSVTFTFSGNDNIITIGKKV